MKFDDLRKFCITLASTPNRTVGFLDEAVRVGLKNYSLYFGLHPGKLPNLPEILEVSPAKSLLTLNHYALWNFIAMQRPDSPFLVLEDDVFFNLDSYDEVLKLVPSDSEFVSFGTQNPHGWSLSDKIEFVESKNFPCTHAYMITPKVAEKMVSLTEHTDMCETIDWYLNKNIYPHLKTVVTTWPIIGQKSIKHTIKDYHNLWPSLLEKIRT